MATELQSLYSKSEVSTSSLKCNYCKMTFPDKTAYTSHVLEGHDSKDDDNHDNAVSTSSTSLTSSTSPTSDQTTGVVKVGIAQHLIHDLEKLDSDHPSETTPDLSLPTSDDSTVKKVNNDLKCDVCDKVLSSKWHLNRHKTNVHKRSKNNSSSFSDKENEAPAKAVKTPSRAASKRIALKTVQAEKTPPPRAAFECKKCDKVYTKNVALIQHIKAIHDEAYKCPRCQFLCPSLRAQKTHLAKKSCPIKDGGKIPFIPKVTVNLCKCCPRGSGSSFNLRQRKQPLDEDLEFVEEQKFFYCEDCGKKFSEFYKLNDHVDVVHNGLKKYDCEECGAQYGYKQSFLGHLRKVHKLPKSVISEIDQNLKMRYENEEEEAFIEEYEDSDDDDLPLPTSTAKEAIPDKQKETTIETKTDKNQDNNNLSPEKTKTVSEKGSKKEIMMEVYDEVVEESKPEAAAVTKTSPEERMPSRSRSTRRKSVPVISKSNSKTQIKREKNSPKPSPIRRSRLLRSSLDGKENLKERTKEEEIKCEPCDLTFVTQETLALHEKTKSHNLKIKKPFECVLCDKEFTRDQFYMRHMKQMHESEASAKFTKCTECDKTFLTKAKYKDHLAAFHKAKTPAKDEGISDVKKTKPQTGKTDKNESSEKDTDAEVVDKANDEKQGYKRKKRGGNKRKPDDDVQPPKPKVARHSSTTSSASSTCEFACTVCDETYITEHLFEAHLKTSLHKQNVEKRESGTTLKENNSAFDSEEDEKVQKPKNSGPRCHNAVPLPNRCDTCDTILRDKKTMQRHLKSDMHKKRSLLADFEKRYACNVKGCIKRFTTFFGLHYHGKKQHNLNFSIKDFPTQEKCDDCHKVFSSPSSLGRHVKVMHKYEERSCPFCEMTFNKMKDFDAHKKNKITCDFCQKPFCNIDLVKEHLLEHL